MKSCFRFKRVTSCKITVGDTNKEKFSADLFTDEYLHLYVKSTFGTQAICPYARYNFGLFCSLKPMQHFSSPYTGMESSTYISLGPCSELESTIVTYASLGKCENCNYKVCPEYINALKSQRDLMNKR